MKKVEKSFHIHINDDSTGYELAAALRASCGILDEVAYLLMRVADYVENDEGSRELLADAAVRLCIASFSAAHVAIDLEAREAGRD